MRRKQLYPCAEEVKQGRYTSSFVEDEPDFIAGAPNYDKFIGWTTEEVLVWLNVD